MEMYFQEMNTESPCGDNIDLQSWLFEGDSFIGPSDFGGGTIEKYSFSNGQGSISPQAITSDDIPGWTESHTTDWYADLNLDDCLQANLKGNDWDENLLGKDAKWVQSVYDDSQKMMPIEDPFSPQWNRSSIEDIKFENDPIPFKDLDGNFSGSLESLAGKVEDIFCNRVDVELENRDYIIDAQPYEHVMYENSPTIISVPISDAMIQPQLKVLEFDEPNSCDDNQIIYCKKFTSPLRKVGQPQLKDVITEKGDELVRDLVELGFCNEETSTIHIDDIGFPISVNSHCSSPISVNSHCSSPTSGSSHCSSPTSGSSHCSSPISGSSYCSLEPAVETTRKRPYSLAERKLRKKEQNKRAAIKYREKKKEEQEQIFGSIEEFEDRNNKLKREHQNLVSEMDIVKRLFVDLLKRKKDESHGI